MKLLENPTLRQCITVHSVIIRLLGCVECWGPHSRFHSTQTCTPSFYHYLIKGPLTCTNSGRQSNKEYCTNATNSQWYTPCAKQIIKCLVCDLHSSLGKKCWIFFHNGFKYDVMNYFFTVCMLSGLCWSLLFSAAWCWFICFIHRLHRFLRVSYLMHIYTSFFMLKGMGILGAFDQFVFINFYHFC